MQDHPNPSPDILPPSPGDLPYRQAALSLTLSHPLAGDIAFEAMVQSLEASAYAGAGELEPLMALQARVLDTLFQRSVLHATSAGAYEPGIVELALRAQRQCRETVTTLRALQTAEQEDKRRGWIKAERKLAREDRADEKFLQRKLSGDSKAGQPRNEKKDWMKAFKTMTSPPRHPGKGWPPARRAAQSLRMRAAKP